MYIYIYIYISMCIYIYTYIYTYIYISNPKVYDVIKWLNKNLKTHFV